jgi:hypothetical protein
MEDASIARGGKNRGANRDCLAITCQRKDGCSDSPDGHGRCEEKDRLCHENTATKKFDPPLLHNAHPTKISFRSERALEQGAFPSQVAAVIMTPDRSVDVSRQAPGKGHGKDTGHPSFSCKGGVMD